jgi:orotate phosphoribosyltransferase
MLKEDKDVYEMLLEIGAICKGHFRLSSGLHSDTYIQVSRVFEFPETAEKVIKYFISKNNLNSSSFDLVASPAMGGILPGYEAARGLNTRNIFFERQNGAFQLRRGFKVPNHARVLIMEDVITTGKSYQEIALLLEGYNAEVKVGCIVNRSRDEQILSCLKLEILTYEGEACPQCKEGLAMTTEGSRWTV